MERDNPYKELPIPIGKQALPPNPVFLPPPPDTQTAVLQEEVDNLKRTLEMTQRQLAMQNKQIDKQADVISSIRKKERENMQPKIDIDDLRQGLLSQAQFLKKKIKI